MSEAGMCERCGWALSGHIRSQYGLDCPTRHRPGFHRSSSDRAGEPQTLVVSHEELCGCVLDDCEFKKGWRAALRAVSKWGGA